MLAAPISYIKKGIRKIGIQLYQKWLFKKNVGPGSDLVVMLVPGDGLVSGGILSIYAFYYATKKLFPLKKILICTYPGKTTSLRYKWFYNHVDLISFDIVLANYKNYKSVVLHLPEYYIGEFMESLTAIQIQQLKDIKLLHINVMNQNAEMMPSEQVFAQLFNFTDNVTITTAHERYTTIESREKYQVPIHLLSAWFEQNELVVTNYNQKEDILIVSHDAHPMKEIILKSIRESMPNVKQIIIKDMKYDDYKKLEAVAKWSISFGEGFDGYTIFPALKGGITFAVYNELFFNEKYKVMKTFYKDFDLMNENIAQDMLLLDEANAYQNYNRQMRNLLEQDYSYSLYEKRVSDFYKGNYTFK